MNYKGNWSLATKFVDRCEIQMCIMQSDLDEETKVSVYLGMLGIWTNNDIEDKEN
jgi:hypothetical protein